MPGMYGFQMSGAGTLTFPGMTRISLRAACAAGAWSGAAWTGATDPRANAKTPTLNSIFLKLGLIADTFYLLSSRQIP